MWQSRNAAPRVEVPRPVQLGSLKSENEGQDPGIRLVPAGGGGWGRPKEDVEEEAQPTNPRVGLTSQPAQLRPTAWGRTSISAQAGPRPAPWAQPAPGTAWQEPVEKKQEEFPTLGSEPKGRRNSGSGSLSLGLGASSSSSNMARPIGAPVPAPEKRPVLPPPPTPSPPPAAERRAKDEDSDKAVEKRSPVAAPQSAPAKATAERPRTTSEDSDKEFMKTLADKRRAEKKDEEEERSRQQFARAQEKLRLLETRAKERQRQEDEERQEQLRVLRGEVKRDDPYEPMQSDTLEQVVAPAFAEVPPPPAPVPEAAPEPPAAVPEAVQVAPSKATFPKPPPPKKAASFYVPPPVPPPKAPPVPPKQVASAEMLRPPPRKEAVAPPKAASSCSVWGDLDDLRPVRGNADQQFPDISSGPQSKKEKQKTAAKNLVEPVAKHPVQAMHKFGHAQRAAPTFNLQDLMKPSKKGRSAKIFSGKAALPQQTGAFVEEGAGDPELDAEPAEPVQKPPSPKLTPNGILQRAPREKRDDGSRRVRDPKGEDTEDVEVTIQTQMKIDPQKPLRILQKSAEEKAKEQEAHAPRVEPRTEASNKGVSKGEGKQGKGSGKSKDKGKSKGKGRGPRVYGEDSDAEWSVASSHSSEEKESPVNESSPVVVSSEDEDSRAAKPAHQEKGHGKDAKGKGKGKAKGKDKKGGKKGWIVKTKSSDSDEDDEEVHETPAAHETPALPETGKQQFEKRQRNLKSVLESRAATRAEAERQRKMLREKAAGAEVQPVKVEENSPTSPVDTEQKQEEEEEEPPVVPQSSILSEEAMGRLNPVADTGLALGIGMVCVQGEEKQVDSDELLDFETVKNKTEKKAEMREQRRVQEEQATRAAIRREAQRQRDMRAKEAQEAKASQMAQTAEPRQAPRQQTIKLADLRRNVGKERMESESAEAAQEELAAHVEVPRRQAMKLSDLRYNVPEDQPLNAVPPVPPRQETWTTGEVLPYPKCAPPPYRPPDVREQVRKILMAERRAFSAGEANRNPLVTAPPMPTTHVAPVPPPAPMPRAPSAPSVPPARRMEGKGVGKPFGDADGWETWSPEDWKKPDYCPEWAWAEEEAPHAKGAEERRREIMAAANEWRNRKASAKGSKSSPKGKGEAKGKAESKGKAQGKGKGDSKGKSDAKGKADGRGKGDKGGKSKGAKGQSKGAQWWH